MGPVRGCLVRCSPAVTSKPARLQRLACSDTIRTGADADLVALDATGRAQTVIIRGTMHVHDGELLRRGDFEHHGSTGAA
jgi:beta-aspartyl-dipeptidase (metallo-type)